MQHNYRPTGGDTVRSSSIEAASIVLMVLQPACQALFWSKQPLYADRRSFYADRSSFYADRSSLSSSFFVKAMDHSTYSCCAVSLSEFRSSKHLKWQSKQLFASRSSFNSSRSNWYTHRINGSSRTQYLCPHSRCFGSYFDVIFLMYLVSSGFSFKPTSSSSSSSSTQFSQEWVRRKVVVKHSIKSNQT